MDDRRLFARIDVKIPLRFLVEKSDIEKKGETVDISANGVGFITNETVPPDTELEFWLDIPDHHQPLHLCGRVVWTKVVKENQHLHVGVCLENQEFIGLARAICYKGGIGQF